MKGLCWVATLAQLTLKFLHSSRFGGAQPVDVQHQNSPSDHAPYSALRAQSARDSTALRLAASG